MTSRGYFVSGVFVTITIVSMVSMLHTLWILEDYAPPVYSYLQLAGLTLGSLGSFAMLYLWDTAKKT